MKILHIASFAGNVGDIANHKGFFDGFARYVSNDNFIVKEELRRFYKNVQEKEFNSEYLEYINTFDLLLLGGGGFFTVQWNYSKTGTTFDWSREFVEGIRIPVIVNAMGYHEYTNNEILYRRFYDFLKLIYSRDNWFIKFRNDGSISRLINRYCDFYHERSVPDNAFNIHSPKLPKKSIQVNTVGIMFSMDLLDINYNRIDKKSILQIMQGVIRNLLNQGTRVILFQHTPQDIFTICKLLSTVDNLYMRTQVMVAAYDAVEKNSVYRLLEYYNLCDCIVSTRFHGNVLALTQHIPTIGLAGHEQIQGLFEELGLESQLIIINSSGYGQDVIKKVERFTMQSEEIVSAQDEVLIKLRSDSEKYFIEIKKFLYSNGKI